MSSGLLLASLLLGDPFTLEWTAPDGCPTQDDVQQRLAAALEATAGPPLDARAVIVATQDEQFRLELSLGRDGVTEGTRILEGETCAEVSDAAVLIVAIAIDPNAAEALIPLEPEPEPAAAPDPAVVPEPAPAAEPEPEPETATQPVPEPAAVTQPGAAPVLTAPVPRLAVRVDAAIGGGLDVGILPSVGGVLSVLAALHGPLWRAEFGASYATPRERSAPSNPEVGGRFQLWSVDVRGCPVLGGEAVTVPLCIGVRAGLMHGAGRGAGLQSNTAAASPWVAASLVPTLLWRPPAVAGGRLLLGARAEASVSLTRPGFSTAQGGPLFEAGAVGGQFSALLGFALR